MNKRFTIIGLSFILIAIIFGAMAAHSLENIVNNTMLLTFEKGVKYLMYSGIGLLVISLNAEKFNFSLTWPLRIIVLGTVLFSGNIFLYVFYKQVPNLNYFVHFVPLGGLLLISGWALLLIQTLKNN